VAVFDTRGECHASDDAMESKTKSGTTPGEVVAMLVVVIVLAGYLAVFNFMVVETEKSLDKKHGHQTE